MESGHITKRTKGSPTRRSHPQAAPHRGHRVNRLRTGAPETGLAIKRDADWHAPEPRHASHAHAASPRLGEAHGRVRIMCGRAACSHESSSPHMQRQSLLSETEPARRTKAAWGGLCGHRSGCSRTSPRAAARSPTPAQHRGHWRIILTRRVSPCTSSQSF